MYERSSLYHLTFERKIPRCNLLHAFASETCTYTHFTHSLQSTSTLVPRVICRFVDESIESPASTHRALEKSPSLPGVTERKSPLCRASTTLRSSRTTRASEERREWIAVPGRGLAFHYVCYAAAIIRGGWRPDASWWRLCSHARRFARRAKHRGNFD